MIENTKIIYQFETTEADGKDNVAWDVLERYEVHELPAANSQLVVVGFTKDGRQVVNPWSVRPVIRRLIKDLANNRQWHKTALKDYPVIGKKVLWQTKSGDHLIGYLHYDLRVCRPGGSSWEYLSDFVAWQEIEKFEE